MLIVSNPYRYIKNIVCFLFLIVCHIQYAQTDLLFDAQKLCQENKFDLAIPILDKVVNHPETQSDPQAWHMRSYAYLQTYKLTPAFKYSRFDLLDTAIHSAILSMKLDSTKEFLENNKGFIKARLVI